MKSRFQEALLANMPLLADYRKGNPPQPAQIKRKVFLEVRRFQPYHPDHYYLNYRDTAFTSENLAEMLLCAFQILSRNLTFHNQKAEVELQHLETWGRITTRVTPLPLLTHAFFQEFGAERARNILLKHRPMERVTLVGAHHPMIETLIREEGLNDLHVHLNGTTEADEVWQHALRHPIKTYRDLKRAQKVEKVREHYLQAHEGLTEESVRDLLLQARVIREFITQQFSPHSDQTIKVADLLKKPRKHIPVLTYKHHPFSAMVKKKLEDREYEALWWLEVFQLLRKSPQKNKIAQLVHAYLLMLNGFNRLIVQQEDQKGFDQFQKITLNEMRSQVERSFLKRFRQLEGPSGRDLAFLEGKFAPKNTASENREYLKTIIRDYKVYLNRQKKSRPTLAKSLQSDPDKKDILESRLELRLVAHFIKKPETRNSRICRHYFLRRTIANQARILIHLRKQCPELGEFLTGVDAAANELHAPPEVFAPIYRAFRNAGWSNFTYHVGEDFTHLISGIRAILEAITFLNLKQGNRIGHGTAIGIEPKLWLKKTPDRMAISRGEWLDNLVFLYRMVSKEARFSDQLFKIQDEIYKHWFVIYGKDAEAKNLSQISHFISGWLLRDLDPLIVMAGDQRNEKLDNKAQREWDLIKERKQANPQAMEIFRLYHSHKFKAAYSEKVEIDTDFVGEEILLFLQNQVIKLMNDRLVAVEAMPTSNVRIAQYQSYKDHHLFRWLNLKRDSRFIKPIVVLASDDPGIFATQLRNEFAQVFQVMIEEYGLSHHDAYRKLKHLNENGKIFRFLN